MGDLYANSQNGEKVSVALEEERRLAYVAVARAQEELIISSQFLYRGKKADASRFIMSSFPRYEANKSKTDSRQPRAEGTVFPNYV